MNGHRYRASACLKCPMRVGSSPGRAGPAQHTADRQVAMEVLLPVAERDGPEMLARIGIMRALNRHAVTATPAPRRKPAKVFRIVR
jgi:hypothetical protein